MNLKPNIKKIIFSLIGMIVLGFLFGILYKSLFCIRVGCIAMIIPCDYYNIFSCCSNCVSQLTHTFQLITIFLPSFLISYLGYSFFQNRKEKNLLQFFLAILIILILTINLIVISNYLKSKDNSLRLSQESERAKNLNQIFSVSINLMNIQFAISLIPKTITNFKKMN